MEDNLYRMDDQLESCLLQLESSKRNNAALRLQLAERGKATPSTKTTQQPAATPQPDNGDDTEPFDEEKESPDDELFNLEAPQVELGSAKTQESTPQLDATKRDEVSRDATPADKTFELPEGNIQVPTPRSILKSNTGDDAPQIEPYVTPPGQLIEPMEAPAIDPSDNPFRDDEAPTSTDGQVTRIILNPRLTGGFNADRKQGHDGIMVVIEPQDAYARYIPLAGPVSIELRDPSKPGIAGQVGTWHYTALEAQAHLKKSLMGQGIHLELPWPIGSPTSKKLELSVAYENSAGTKLRTQQVIHITPTTSALVGQADAAERSGWYHDRDRTPTTANSQWQPLR